MTKSHRIPVLHQHKNPSLRLRRTHRFVWTESNSFRKMATLNNIRRDIRRVLAKQTDSSDSDWRTCKSNIYMTWSCYWQRADGFAFRLCSSTKIPAFRLHTCFLLFLVIPYCKMRPACPPAIIRYTVLICWP
jgi:hypothetical protein